VTTFVSNPANVLGVVLLAAIAVRVIWLWAPQGQLIFDEAYYVNAARVLLSYDVPAGASYADAALGVDPNAEHPPLGKVLIAASILIFGDSGVGWRLPSVIASLVALAALYGIVRAAGETAWLGVLAVALFAADNLALVHARIGTLDMLALAPLLVGAWLALRQRWVLAGVALGLGSLVRINGAFAVLAVVALLAVELVGRWRASRRLTFLDIRPAVLLVSSYAIVTIAGLWILDYAFTGQRDPWAHLLHMLSYGASLTAPEGPTGIASQPWQWLVNDVEITYLKVEETVSANGQVIAQRPTIDFRGAMNPALIGALPLAFMFALWRAVRADDRLARWAIAWALANYLPFYVFAIVSHRITYLYYFLPVIPALAVGIALLLRRSELPRFVTWGFLAAVAWGFLAYFPFRRVPM
jgi:predicted membrane-bound dolichyl-phosphate-mannose-protein mannosyltransferase